MKIKEINLQVPM